MNRAFITSGAGAAFGQALGIDGNSTPKQKFGAFLATSAFSGFTAKAQGGDFWEGARQGATIAALNHLSHSLTNDITSQIDNKQAQNREGNGKIENLLNESFKQERQRNIDNREGYYDQFYEEESTINVDFNRVQKFLKGKMQQRTFLYENINVYINEQTLEVSVLFKPAEVYDRNIVNYVEIPSRQPIHPNTVGVSHMKGYGLYLINNTGNWATATVFFKSQADLKLVNNYLIGN